MVNFEVSYVSGKINIALSLTGKTRISSVQFKPAFLFSNRIIENNKTWRLHSEVMDDEKTGRKELQRF